MAEPITPPPYDAAQAAHAGQLGVAPEELETIHRKLRSGEFYAEARDAYSFHVHDSMAERYFYAGITLFSFIILIVALGAMGSMFPLSRSVAFMYENADFAKSLPVVEPLKTQRKEDANAALRRFLMSNYVLQREGYRLSQLERNGNGVRAQSTEEVYAAYEQAIDPRNPQSPIAMFQGNFVREIKIISGRTTKADLASGEYTGEVVFDAFVNSSGRRDTTRWIANIAFRYQPVLVDDEAKITPFQFMVTQYSVRRTQDIK